MDTTGIYLVYAGCNVSRPMLAQMQQGALDGLVSSSVADHLARALARHKDLLTVVDLKSGGKGFRADLVVLTQQRFYDLLREVYRAGEDGHIFSPGQLQRELEQKEREPEPKVGPSAEEVQRVAKALGVDTKRE